MPDEPSGRARCPRRILRYAFFDRKRPGEIARFLLENPYYIKLTNSWLILNSDGGPTPDKLEVILETPPDLNRMSSFMNLRAADIWSCYRDWSAKGTHFLTEPLDNHGREWRCYMRDPDGYLIEVGKYNRPVRNFQLLTQFSG